MLCGVNRALNASPAQELQKKADLLREEGKSLEAIDLYNQALASFQEEKDYGSIIGALTGRLLAWKHLFYKTEAKIYAIIVKKEAETMLEITKEYGLKGKDHLLHFLNGTAAMLLQDYATGENEFRQAVALFPANNAEKGDWTAHLGEALYRNGKKEEGQKMILKGVEIIQHHASELDPFLYNVWVSGAYLRLAKLLKVDNQEESSIFFSKAQKIIESDDRLVIRKGQLKAFTNEAF